MTELQNLYFGSKDFSDHGEHQFYVKRAEIYRDSMLTSARDLYHQKGYDIEKKFPMDMNAFVRPPVGLNQTQVTQHENSMRLYTTYTTAPGDLDFNYMRQTAGDSIFRNNLSLPQQYKLPYEGHLGLKYMPDKPLLYRG